MVDVSRYRLDALEFQSVRDLLVGKLTTTLGRRAVGELVPLGTAEAASAALQEAVELARRLRHEDRPPLSGAVEVRSWTEAFFRGENQPETKDLADLKRLLRSSEQCRGWLAGAECDVALVAMAGGFPQVYDIFEALDRVVDDRGEVLDSASVRLGDIRREIDAADAAVRAAVALFVSDPGVRRCLQSVEPSWRHGRPVFQVRYELRGRVPGVTHDRSQSGATVFVEPSSVVGAANRLSDAKADEHREIQVVTAEICRALRKLRTEIEGAIESVVGLDLALARGKLIHEEGFQAPRVRAEGLLRLRDALHPVLLATHQREELVPLDVTLGDPYTMLVITGPNTGGKTVALKTIGLLSLMALCGVPIPAALDAQVPYFDSVYADIGDEQGISQNLSTFSSHVTRIVGCLDRSTTQSLILLDELGAGTDPEEGGALGYAVLEEIEKRRVCAVVTTHLGQLKAFAYEHQWAENGAMAFDNETLEPLFRLDVGIPGMSHALDIAARVGMPSGLVSRARELLGRRDSRLETVIDRVQVARRRAEEERQRRELMSRDAELVGRELEQQKGELQQREAWLHEEADALVEEELRAARTLLEERLACFVNAPRPYGADAKDLLGSLRDLLKGNSLHRRRMKFVATIRKNAVVYVPRLRKLCTVRKVDRVRETLAVEIGKMRLEVPFDDVSWLQPIEL